MAKDEQTKQSKQFPPVIAVLGHVDHGKTTLLDAIRKSTIADREHGGITQKIGASTVEILHEGEKRRITFIDTPGHEAFSTMRGRGAQAADIGLLIVAASEGVKPQTQESIKLLQAANIPFIVVLTKIDLPTAIPDKAKQMILKEGILLEGYGGDVPVIEVSAKDGRNVKELLDLILLVGDIHNIHTGKAAGNPLKAIIIESKRDLKIGPKITVIVKDGTLKAREDVVCEDQEARIRAMIDTTGKQIQEITVGDAAELLGFTTTPPVGSMVYRKGEAALVAKKQQALTQSETHEIHFREAHELPIILVADTQGSLEAIIQAFPEGIRLIDKKTGEVSESDVLMAKSIGGVVLSFNTKLRTEVIRLAENEKILLRNYTIIYEMLDEIKDVMEGKKLALEERIYGTAKVLAIFPYEKTKVLGIKVMQGRVAKGDKVRILHGETVVGEGTISSVRQGKNQTSKVEEGTEAGIVITPMLDFTIGDMVICHA